MNQFVSLEKDTIVLDDSNSGTAAPAASSTNNTEVESKLSLEGFFNNQANLSESMPEELDTKLRAYIRSRRTDLDEKIIAWARHDLKNGYGMKAASLFNIMQTPETGVSDTENERAAKKADELIAIIQK